MPQRAMRRLTEEDRSKALAFLQQEPLYNVFTIGDIENFGFDTEFQDVWADTDIGGDYRVLVLRYYNNYVVYAPNDQTDFNRTVSLLEKNVGRWILSGKESIVCSIAAGLGIADKDIEKQSLAELKRELFDSSLQDPVDVEWATDDTFPEVMHLQSQIEEFSVHGGSSEAIECNQKSGTGRTAVVRVGGKVVSSASSAAENSQSAMIIGACTAQGYRGRGYASACMQALCAQLLKEKKAVCLFYTNPAAARIYMKMGFRDIGHWGFVGMNT